MLASSRSGGLMFIALIFLISSVSGQSYNLLYVKQGEAAGDRFGNSVAIAGNKFIVGAPFVDTNGVANVGAAYIYSGADGTLDHKMNGWLIGAGIDPDGVIDDRQNRFGWSVSGSGDMNGDGVADFLIGTPREITSPLWLRYGFVSVYSGATGQNIWKMFGPTYYYDRFGWAVDDVGDLNNDGMADIIVGAPTYEGSGGPGLAEVWSPAAGTRLYVSAGLAGAGDSLGFSVTGAGDINGLGKPDFIIGASRANPNGNSNAGSVFVIAGEDFSVIHQIHGVASGDEFGSAVAGIGDIYGNDGKSEFIVGAPCHDTLGMSNVGKVYVFNGATGQPIHTLKGEAATNLFGSSLSGGGDINGDGKPDFVVGAPHADSGGKIAVGAAHVFSGADCSLLFKKYGSNNYDKLGYSISCTGDINGDGKADFIIGVPEADPNGLNSAGIAYVYGFFDASPPSVTVTDPNGAEYVSKSPCPPYTITWNASDNVGVTGIEIWLDRTNNGSFEQQIANLSGNPGSYDWIATGSNSTNAKIKVIARDAAGNSSSDVSDGVFTIGPNCYLKPVATLPTFDLGQNYPNPFNANTNIFFSLDAPVRVELAVYNILGEKVRTLLREDRSAGSHEVAFDGRDDKGNSLSSGVYFYKLNAGERIVTKQMMLIK